MRSDIFLIFHDDVFLFVQSSFNSVHSWLEEIKCYADSKVLRLLVGNKCDLEPKRAVPTATAKALADELHMPFLETSAKDATNVEQAFFKMAQQIAANATSMPGMQSATVTVNNAQPVRPSGGCC
ncbi:Ras-related protein RABD2a [Clonorchis sinensis]|uniref:Ras-related protein RABD2a n=1 Tax=Clonorchis sinensis TaxID=79923 RepID=G7YC47_CLOSI|nr:Ras-related protein RABD2a [Clonorchis sinensis]